MSDTETMPPPAALRELAVLTGKAPPSYHSFWCGLATGRFPAEQVNGRYRIRRADLPAIAATLGMKSAA